MKSTSSLQLTFQRRLKQERLAKGLSQKGLGIAAGIDEFVASTRINRYENGIHEADLATSHRLAQVLEISPSYFYEEDDALAEIILTHKKI